MQGYLSVKVQRKGESRELEQSGENSPCGQETVQNEKNVSRGSFGSGQRPVGGKITQRTATLSRILNSTRRIWTFCNQC